MKLFYVCHRKNTLEWDTSYIPLKEEYTSYVAYYISESFTIFIRDDLEVKQLSSHDNPEYILSELKSCDFYVPNNILSVMIGESLGIKPVRPLEDDYLYVVTSIGKVVEILTNNYTDKSFKFNKKVIEIVNNSQKDIRNRVEMVREKAKILLAYVNKMDLDINKFAAEINERLYIEVFPSLDIYNQGFRTTCMDLFDLYNDRNEEVFNIILKRCLELVKTKKDFYYCNSFMRQYYKVSDLEKRGMYCNSDKNFIFKNDGSELFKIFKKRLDTFTKQIERTVSYSGFVDIIWLADFIDWSLLKRHNFLKEKCFDYEYKYIKKYLDINEDIPEEYKYFIDLIKYPYEFQSGVFIGFIGMCEESKFEEIKEHVADALLNNYAHRASCNSGKAFAYYFKALPNQKNVISLMNCMVNKISKKDLSKNKIIFREFMRDFNVEGIINHIDFTDSVDFKKVYVNHVLKNS